MIQRLLVQITWSLAGMCIAATLSYVVFAIMRGSSTTLRFFVSGAIAGTIYGLCVGLLLGHLIWKNKLSPFRFSVRTMLISVTLASIALALFAYLLKS
jgi:hypothetical protein